MNRSAPARCLIWLTGQEGYARVLHSLQSLLEWMFRVAVLELGACGTFWILKVLQAPFEMSGLSAVRVHRWIACIGMLGIVVSELLYEARGIVKHLAEIRSSWMKGKS